MCSYRVDVVRTQGLPDQSWFPINGVRQHDDFARLKINLTSRSQPILKIISGSEHFTRLIKLYFGVKLFHVCNVHKRFLE